VQKKNRIVICAELKLLLTLDILNQYTQLAIGQRAGDCILMILIDYDVLPDEYFFWS